MKENSYKGKFTPHISQKKFFISLGGKPILPRKKGAGFIVIEGLDGSGQSTQAGLLKNYLIKNKFNVVLTKEPTSNSGAGKRIKRILEKKEKIPQKKLQELFALDRREHLKKIITPALKKGKIVVSDRYFFSSFAYGTAEGLSLNSLIKLNKDFLMPDLTFILRVRPEICLKRIKKRDKETTLFEEKEKLEKIWKTYKTLPKRFSSYARGYGGSAEALREGGKNVYPVRKPEGKIEAHKRKIDFSKGVYIIDGEKSIQEVFSQIKDLLHIHN